MIRLMKNKKSGKIVTKFEAITPKSYSYCVKFTRENGVKNQKSTIQQTHFSHKNNEVLEASNMPFTLSKTIKVIHANIMIKKS